MLKSQSYYDTIWSDYKNKHIMLMPDDLTFWIPIFDALFKGSDPGDRWDDVFKLYQSQLQKQMYVHYEIFFVPIHFFLTILCSSTDTKGEPIRLSEDSEIEDSLQELMRAIDTLDVKQKRYSRDQFHKLFGDKVFGDSHPCIDRLRGQPAMPIPDFPEVPVAIVVKSESKPKDKPK